MGSNAKWGLVFCIRLPVLNLCFPGRDAKYETGPRDMRDPVTCVTP
jgi:hypothetical protein